MRTLKCAIYTRKSSDDGLEQEFNSLDAQREACDAYITSQKHAGWVVLPDMYDDGGLSGGTLERPALKRLLEDVKARKVQVIVVYKVDRLTRSLSDFAKIVDVLDGHDASFVSVTQQFNTTTSMGRLTLNMLLSFAQFEREIAGERIRDKIAASKAKGMWMGGNVPLGYDAVDTKLVINESEAETVRVIFQLYLEVGVVSLLRAELDKRGIVSKRREGAGGKLSGGNKFSRGALYTLLQNQLYRGKIAHKGEVYPGQHDAIIDEELWQKVQEKLASNRYARSLSAGATAPSMLAGLIVDSEGHAMTPTHANKSVRGEGGGALPKRNSKRYRYYVSKSLITGRRGDHPGCQRIPAGDVERLVLDRMRTFFACESEVASAIAPLSLNAETQRCVLLKSQKLADRWVALGSLELRELVRSVLNQVKIEYSKIVLQLNRAKIAKCHAIEQETEASAREQNLTPFVLTIEARLKRAGKGTRLVIGNSNGAAKDTRLVQLMKEAFTTRQNLMSGSDDSIEAMARRLDINRGYLTSLVRVSYLAPDIVRDILCGRHPVDLSATKLLSMSKNIPHDWRAQRQFLKFTSP